MKIEMYGYGFAVIVLVASIVFEVLDIIAWWKLSLVAVVAALLTCMCGNLPAE